jgi:hypothetical protein
MPARPRWAKETDLAGPKRILLVSGKDALVMAVTSGVAEL